MGSLGWSRTRRAGTGFGHQLAFATAVILGIASVGLYSWGFRQWDRHFSRLVPLLDDLMLAKDALADGYVWLEAHVRGNPTAQVEAIDESFARALQAVDAGLQGSSPVEGLSGVAITDETLLRRLVAYRDAIVQTGALARERARLPPGAPEAAELDLRLFTAAHGLSLLAEAVSADLHRDLRRTLASQQRLQAWTLTLWLTLVGGAGLALFVSGKKRAAAESALRQAHDALEQKVAERTAELTRANEQLLHSERELRSLSSQLLTVQEDERARIARELHDGISQTLGAAKFRVEHVLSQIRDGEDLGAEESCGKVVDILRGALDEARRTYMGLRPSVLDDLGIVATIDWFCREYAAVHPGIAIEKAVRLEQEGIPDPIKTAVFRILQEAMNNVAKHSGARRVRVGLEGGSRGLSLSVEDDGCGFDPAGAPEDEGPRGMGLGSMRERARGTGGVFGIESAPGRGTRVRVRWPPAGAA